MWPCAPTASLPTGRGFGLGDHLCWPFDGYDDFRREALAFLADGARLGQRLLYTADRPHDDLPRDVLDWLPDADESSRPAAW